MQFLGYNNMNPCCFLKFPHTLSNHNTYQGGVLRISSDRDDLKGTKIKPQKNPEGLLTKPPKIHRPKINPQKSHAEFPSLRCPECNALNIKTAAKIAQKFLYLNQATKKYLPNFLAPKKSQNRKFQTQKNPSIIPVT